MFTLDYYFARRPHLGVCVWSIFDVTVYVLWSMFHVTVYVLWSTFGVTMYVLAVAAKKMKLVPVDMSSEVVQEWMERIIPNRRDLYALCCDKADMTHEVHSQVCSKACSSVNAYPVGGIICCSI